MFLSSALAPLLVLRAPPPRLCAAPALPGITTLEESSVGGLHELVTCQRDEEAKAIVVMLTGNPGLPGFYVYSNRLLHGPYPDCLIAKFDGLTKVYLP